MLADEVWVMLARDRRVAQGIGDIPRQDDRASSEVMVIVAWAGPEKSMPMGLSALTDSVRVSSACKA